MIFVYEYSDSEGHHRGKMTASNKEEALRSLAKMGITECSIGVEGQPLERNSSPQPLSDKIVIASVDEDEVAPDPLETIEPVQDPKVPQVPIAWPKVPIPEPVKVPSPSPEPAYIDVRRKQSVLYGTHESIRAEIQRLLSLFGEVKFMNTVQDMRGNILIAIVIEHDEPLPKEKP